MRYNEDDDERGSVGQRCPVCRKRFAVLADEAGQHACPHCGCAPYDEAGPEDEPEEAEEAGPEPDRRCAACRAFFARYQCGKATYLECDCPRCQGYCTCADGHDPHCTCPDCVTEHAESLGDDNHYRPLRGQNPLEDH